MRGRRHVVVVGDAVLDRDVEGRVERLCPDSPAPVIDVEHVSARPGGAGLAALMCTGEGLDVTLITPVAEDSDGQELRSLLEDAGVLVLPLGHEGGTRVKTRLRAGGQSIARIDTGGPGHPVGALRPEAASAIAGASVVLVSCYGGGATAHDGVRAELSRRARGRPVVWDPHPRGPDPVDGCALVTPNLVEARNRVGMPSGHGDIVARHLTQLWSARAVAVTAGQEGAWVATGAGEPLLVPTVPVPGDSCGAGDRFASAAAIALALGRTLTEAVTYAVQRAGEFVAAGGASGLGASPRSRATSPGPDVPGRSPDRIGDVRRAGGVLVATGGCFDLLHAGHVSMLEAARALGDGLVVLLNSDTSVRRLKGPGRPVHSQDDRARVLLGLSCVDAVIMFDESDPRAALQSLRPDIWTKGGDYEDAELPEAALVRSWGGRVILLPYLSGRSTTAVLQSIPTGENL